MANAIELREVSFTYGEGTVFRMDAVNGISIDIEEGKVTGVIGHTGSGKSTLIQMMNGLIKPASGSVKLFGEDIFKDKKKLASVRFRVGLVFQYPEYQLFEETVYRDISYGPRNMKLTESEIDERVRESAGFVGLDETFFKRSPFELSGGQKRRVAIAGIMAMRPDVLVLDEPASGLDPAGKKEIFDGLIRYLDGGRRTVVIVSHSMEDMAKYADNLVVLSHGECVMQGTKQEVFGRADELRGAGLDVPAASSLTDRLRDAGMPLGGGIFTVNDAVDAILAALSGKGGGL